MNKKVVIFCAVLASLLLVAIGYVSYNLFFSDDSHKGMVDDARIDVLEAVPTDAVFVYDFKKLADFYPYLISDNAPLRVLISKLPSEAKEWGALFSLHYSSKNQVSPLFVLSIPQNVDKKEFATLLEKECSGISHKKYGANLIYRSIVPDVNYSFFNNYLIASTSIFVLESSLRHLEGNTSILDNALFSQMVEYESGNSSFLINNQNLGKLFSGAVNPSYLGAADFSCFFSSAAMVNLDGGSNYLFGEGRLFNTKDEANYSNVFSCQKSKESLVYKVLPNSTNYVVSIPINSPKEYLDSYALYFQSRKKSYFPTKELKDWFLSLGVSEIAVSSFTVGDLTERVILMKIDNSSSFVIKDNISSLLGKMFIPTHYDSFIKLSDWVIIGGKKFLAKYEESYNSMSFFSFEDYLLQTPAAACCKGVSNISTVINLDRCKDSITNIIKEQYSKDIIKGLTDNNFNFAAARIVVEQGKISLKTSLFLDNLTQLPVPKQLAESAYTSEGALVDDTPIVVPQGPFKVKNFTNGKTNYLEQQSNNMLRMLDDKKKGLWTIPFDAPLCGYVSQIDYFKNGKLQMIFGAGKKVYLLDRLGRWVSPFPIDLRREIVLGPKVYDFLGDKNYSLMVLHSDNKVVLYDLKGKVIKGWNQITSNEKIKSLPELLKMEIGRYWILRTSFQTMIFDSNGVIVADFTKKRRLKPDSKVQIKSSKEVIVTTVEDKTMILNLQSGTFKSYK